MDDTALKFLTSQPKEIVRATSAPVISRTSEQSVIPVVAETEIVSTGLDSHISAPDSIEAQIEATRAKIASFPDQPYDPTAVFNPPEELKKAA